MMPRLRWTETAFPILDSAFLTTQMFELDRSFWPQWATRSTQFERMWVFTPISSQIPGGMSTAQVVGKLLTERFDQKDDNPFNYNYYIILRTTEGKYLQSSPIKTTDIDHHSSSPLP